VTSPRRHTAESISNVPGPALATLSEPPLPSSGWLFERKLDGMRVLATRRNGSVSLRSRSGAKTDASFPEIVETLEAQHTPDLVVDGEVVAFDGERTSFGTLQPRIHLADPARARRIRVDVYYYLFDLLHLDGHSTRGLPLRERKALLRDVFEWDDPLRFATYQEAGGDPFLEEACAQGWEGVIAKRADAAYHSGRTHDWLKFKCEQSQEFVVGGWTDPQGSRVGLGSLLLGYYDEDGALVYAGRVGTGFDRAMLTRLRRRLDGLARATAPYNEQTLPNDPATRVGVHWVRPELVADVVFGEWTRDGVLRHPRFRGLRTDKPARDIVRERPTR
jgi:bifunctional non-homologous end joining protein LigD